MTGFVAPNADRRLPDNKQGAGYFQRPRNNVTQSGNTVKLFAAACLDYVCTWRVPWRDWCEERRASLWKVLLYRAAPYHTVDSTIGFFVAIWWLGCGTDDDRLGVHRWIESRCRQCGRKVCA